MKQFIRLALKTGHTYEIPVAVVANSRAAYYFGESQQGEFPTLEAAMANTIAVFSEDSREITDWATNNMNWAEIEPHARLVRFTAPDTPWHEGEFSFHDYPALISELDGETILKQPVEMVATTMLAANQLCNVTVIQGEDGQATAALAMVVGDQSVITKYLGALKFVTDQITADTTQIATTESPT